MGTGGGGGSHNTQGPPSYRVWGGGGEGEARAPLHPCPTYNQMHAGFSFSYLRLLRQPLLIKMSYAGAVHMDRKFRGRLLKLYDLRGGMGEGGKGGKRPASQIVQ
jgi:hypothetical protein